MLKIEQPWGDHRLKMNGVFIGCVTKENADIIMPQPRLFEDAKVGAGDTAVQSDLLLPANGQFQGCERSEHPTGNGS